MRVIVCMIQFNYCNKVRYIYYIKVPYVNIQSVSGVLTDLDFFVNNRQVFNFDKT